MVGGTGLTGIGIGIGLGICQAKTALKPPSGFVFLTDADGAYLTDADGKYLLAQED